jgi:hypothetical protein
MTTLRIEHPVPHFEGWKSVFDSDPMGRERSGVRRHQVARSIHDPNYVMIDLDFDSVDEAQAFLASLRQLWAGAGGQVSANQQARIVEIVETREYALQR